MSIGNIFILSVLISLGTCHSIRRESIRDEVIPKLNVTKMSVKWYLAASTLPEDRKVCMINDVNRQSDHAFSMNLTAILKPGENWKIPHDSNVVYQAKLTVTIKNNSSILTATGGDPVDASKTQFIVIYDIDYDSCMAMYTSETESGIKSGSDGKIFIFCIDTITLSEGTLEEMKQSPFYLQGINHQNDLLPIDRTLCNE